MRDISVAFAATTLALGLTAVALAQGQRPKEDLKILSGSDLGFRVERIDGGHGWPSVDVARVGVVSVQRIFTRFACSLRVIRSTVSAATLVKSKPSSTRYAATNSDSSGGERACGRSGRLQRHLLMTAMTVFVSWHEM